MSNRSRPAADPARWERIQALFHAAADIHPDRQEAFLRGQAPSESDIIDDVRAMLDEDRRGQRLIDAGVAELADRVLSRETLPPHSSFGRYRVARLLGEGGMGVVYQASRDDLGSTVAIKVLRDAWLSPSRRERFIAEQRMLARLNHPAIAVLHDADTLPDGTPYFVMEYVEGEPLTDYCRRQLSDLRDRLILFRQVCEAVQHAHEQLVIHRDLKPSNILVKGDGSVKLLDFGIAKQLDEHARTAGHTMTGLRLMTPAYASPQQIRGEPTGVDTDVYSLGVILYELLADRPPFDFSTRTRAEAEALILEREPERPSATWRRSPISRAGWRRSFNVPASAWADLDVLCLTAMHKDPARRYRTVQAVILDIDHFLSGEPLDARPDSVAYRAGKFARRNRVPLSMAAATIGGLVGMAAFYTLRLARARNTALNEAARAQRIQRFMLNLFEGGDTEAGPTDDLRVTTLLERGVREADALGSEPAARADLYQTLGRIYQKFGHFDRADDLIRRALDAREALFGPESSQVGDSMIALADLRTDQARYDEAERIAREAVRVSSGLPEGHPLRPAAARTLGRVLEERGQYEAAIPVLEDAVRQLEPAGDEVQLANTAHELANVQFYAGHYEESRALNGRALAIYRRHFGDAHPHVGDTLINLGAIDFESGDDASAEGLYREGLAITEAWYGRDHFRTANNLVMLGRTLTRREKLEEASDVLRRALVGRERTYGPNHPSVASVLNELGTIARKRNRLDEAEGCYRKMLDIYSATHLDGRHFLIGIATSNLGSVQQLRGDLEGASRLFREAIAIFSATQGPSHSNTAIARVKLAATLLKQGLATAARTEVASARDTLAMTMKPDAFWMIEARKVMADADELLTSEPR